MAMPNRTFRRKYVPVSVIDQRRETGKDVHLVKECPHGELEFVAAKLSPNDHWNTKLICLQMIDR